MAGFSAKEYWLLKEIEEEVRESNEPWRLLNYMNDKLRWRETEELKEHGHWLSKELMSSILFDLLTKHSNWRQVLLEACDDLGLTHLEKLVKKMEMLQDLKKKTPTVVTKEAQGTEESLKFAELSSELKDTGTERHSKDSRTDIQDTMDTPGPSTAPISTSPNANRNFARLCQLMMTVCVDLFRNVLDFYIEPAELLREMRENFENLKTMISDQQNDLLSMVFESGILSSKMFDLSLLYIVIRSTCNIPEPRNGWGRCPETDDRSLAANIERIRIYGIRVLNESEDINDTDFQDIWQILRRNIVETQIRIKIDTYVEAVDELFSYEQISTRYIDGFQRLKEVTPKWALVLFDWDGCTAIVETKRLVGEERKEVSSRYKLSFDGKMHDIEILGFGNEEDHLHANDSNWERSHRASAISAVRDARELTRRGKFGGYLDVRDGDEDSEDTDEGVQLFKTTTKQKRPRQKKTQKNEPPVQVQKNSSAQNQQKKIVEGTNGRTITIHHEGSGDYVGHASPERMPCSYESLTSDLVGIIQNQVESSKNDKLNVMTMTDDVVMLGSDEDISELCKKCNGVHDVSSRLEKIEAGQKRLEKKLDNLVDILQTFIKKQENFVTIDLNSSSFVIDPNASFQQPLTSSDPQVPVVTCVTSVASAADDIVRTSVTELEETSKQNDNIEETVNTELPELTPTVCELVLQERRENEENMTPEVPKTSQPKTMKKFPSPCKSHAVTTYITSYEDISAGNFHFLIAPEVLSNIKEQSCSDGNFLLNVARRIFKEHELDGRNFCGRKGRPALSPRRRHALQHAFADHASTDVLDFKRAVVALNSGIRGIGYKNSV